MVKIPRYKEQNINLPTGQTDLTSSAVGSQTLSGVAESVRKLVSDVGAKRNALAYRMRRLQITTEVENGKSLIYREAQSFLDSLVDRDDFLNPDEWLIEYQSNIPKLEKQYKKKFDKETWTEFQPYFNWQIFETESKIKKEINTQKIKNAGVAFSQSKEVFMDKVDKADNFSEIEGHWESYQQLLNKNLATDFFPQEFYTEQFVAAENFKNMSIAWLAVKEGEMMKNPFGDNEVDWSGVLRNLKEKVDGEYKYISDLDPDLRKIMITEADKNFSNQYQTHSQMREKKNRAVKKQLTDDLIEIREGTPNGLIISDTFADRIQASDLPETEKRALANSFFTWQQGGAGELWETDMGKKASIMAHMVVYNGLIDTETERIFLTELMNNGLLKTEDYRTLNNKIDENIKDKNFYKKTLYKRAIVMIAKEVGDTKAIRLFQDMDLTKVENLADLISPQLSEEVYEAINYFDQVLAEGERQGFNYVNMLSKKGDNYLMDDVVEFARQVKGFRGAGTIEFSEQFKSMEGFDPNKPYWLAPEVWFYGKEPLLAMDIPLRNKDENIAQYLTRVSGELRKKGNLLPSTLTGFQFDEDFDLNTFAIIPDIAE